jgi:hypothetical protein
VIYLVIYLVAHLLVRAAIKPPARFFCYGVTTTKPAGKIKKQPCYFFGKPQKGNSYLFVIRLN